MAKDVAEHRAPRSPIAINPCTAVGMFGPEFVTARRRPAVRGARTSPNTDCLSLASPRSGDLIDPEVCLATLAAARSPLLSEDIVRERRDQSDLRLAQLLSVRRCRAARASAKQGLPEIESGKCTNDAVASRPLSCCVSTRRSALDQRLSAAIAWEPRVAARIRGGILCAPIHRATVANRLRRFGGSGGALVTPSVDDFSLTAS